MTEVMRAGALGIEIVVSGKVPSARAKSWRFYSGYLKKCGDNRKFSKKIKCAGPFKNRSCRNSDKHNAARS